MKFGQVTFGLDRYTVERRPIPIMEEILVLDMPPSSNHLFYNVYGKGRVKTKEYQAWITRNAWQIKSQNPRRINGQVQILIKLEDKYPRRDCDNAVKPLIDLIADSSHGLRIIDGDHAKVVRKISVEWADIKGVQLAIRKI